MKIENLVEAIDVSVVGVGKIQQLTCFFELTADLMQILERACDLVEKGEVSMLPFFCEVPHKIARNGHFEPQVDGSPLVHVQLDPKVTRCKVSVWCDHSVIIELISENGKPRLSCHVGSFEELKAAAKLYNI